MMMLELKFLDYVELMLQKHRTGESFSFAANAAAAAAAATSALASNAECPDK